jgi:hypothetical protein
VLRNLGFYFPKVGLLGLHLLDDRLDDHIGRTDVLGVEIDLQAILSRGCVPGCS